MGEHKKSLTATSEKLAVEEKQKHILIVDDESEIAQVLKFFFVYSGYKATFVTDGSDALEFVKHIQPDLILLDIAMPIVGGVEVIRKLRAEGNKVPIFVHTAATYISGIKKADLQITAIFTKPTQPSVLLEEINAFFDNPSLITKGALEKKRRKQRKQRKVIETLHGPPADEMIF